jgi:hypothetical protein
MTVKGMECERRTGKTYNTKEGSPLLVVVVASQV